VRPAFSRLHLMPKSAKSPRSPLTAVATTSSLAGCPESAQPPSLLAGRRLPQGAPPPIPRCCLAQAAICSLVRTVRRDSRVVTGHRPMPGAGGYKKYKLRADVKLMVKDMTRHGCNFELQAPNHFTGLFNHRSEQPDRGTIRWYWNRRSCIGSFCILYE
jgi:hypothetical protein